MLTYAYGLVARRAAFVQLSGREPPSALTLELDASLRACLVAVELEYLLARGQGFEQVGASKPV
jgi:hypothetical protein